MSIINRTKKSEDFLKVVSYAGSYFGAVVGAGFASGQEVMQFYSKYGPSSLLAIVLTTVLFIWIGLRFMELGSSLKTDNHGPVMEFLCGKYIGKAFDYAMWFFMFGGFVIMVSGGGTTMTEYFGINVYLGRIIMVAVAVVASIFGLRSILLIGTILAPIVVLATVGIGTTSSIFSSGTLGEAAIQNSAIVHSAPNVWISALIYVSYCVTTNIPILASIGNKEEDKSLRWKGAALGAIALGLCLFCVNFALLSNYALIQNSEIPNAELAKNIWPLLGTMFAFLLLAVIFTATIVGLYNVIARFDTVGSRKSVFISIGLGACAVLLGLIPFSTLIGTLYPIMGYMGLVIMAAAAYKQIKEGRNTASENVNKLN